MYLKNAVHPQWCYNRFLVLKMLPVNVSVIFHSNIDVWVKKKETMYLK